MGGRSGEKGGVGITGDGSGGEKCALRGGSAEIEAGAKGGKERKVRERSGGRKRGKRQELGELATGGAELEKYARSEGVRKIS